MTDTTQLPQLMVHWFYITISVAFIDASFIILRPHSFADGSLGWFFFLYQGYYEVDKLYADTNDSFVYAQSLCNYVEVIVDVIVLYYHYNRRSATELLALIVSVMTFWKSTLYLTVYYNMEFRKDNSMSQEIRVVYFMYGVWVVVPLYCIWVLFNKILEEQRYNNNFHKEIAAIEFECSDSETDSETFTDSETDHSETDSY